MDKHKAGYLSHAASDEVVTLTDSPRTQLILASIPPELFYLEVPTRTTAIFHCCRTVNVFDSNQRIKSLAQYFQSRLIVRYIVVTSHALAER